MKTLQFVLITEPKWLVSEVQLMNMDKNYT